MHWGNISATSSSHGTTRFISSRNSRLPRSFGRQIQPQISLSHSAIVAVVGLFGNSIVHDLCRPSLGLQVTQFVLTIRRPHGYFRLVHGGWRGGWAWKHVAKQLRQEGHDVFTPTMTGLGERSHLLNAGVNLSTNIQDIVNVVRFEELYDIVLCGHSYAGMIISGVADQFGDRIASLMYLDAWLPKDGDSIMSLSPEAMQIETVKGARLLGGYAVPPIPSEVFRVNEKNRAWVDQMCTPHPFSSMTEAIA